MTCPTCSRSIDPLRAPVARISGGRIVTYCSSDCARGIAPPPLDPPPEPAPTLVPSPEPEFTPPPRPEPDAATAGPAPIALAASPPPPALGPAHPEAPVRADASVRLDAGTWRKLALAVVVVAGGAAAVIALSNGDERPAPPPPAPEAAPAPAAAPAPPPVTRESLAGEARALLARMIQDPSPRVRRLAALAYSRTGDPTAAKELLDALAGERSEIARLEVASALARAPSSSEGQAGLAHLHAALKSTRRDVRLEAARALARLGDARGVERLRDALSLTTLRLGAAETLAVAGDAEGLAILHEALASKNQEARMRAAVALGRAGDPAGKDLLRGMVVEGRIEMGAAGALARLGDRECIPALERALALTALRVEAAVALRRLGAGVDPAILAGVLASGDDASRVTAAEAVLVLYDPQPPAELR